MSLYEQIYQTGIVPVVVIDDAKDAVPTADALLAGGVNTMEITLRTPAALDAIKTVAKERPHMLIGAGTVLTLAQCKVCVEAGAQFIVSPGLDFQVVRWCMDNDVPVMPGCVTPTEIMQAMGLGCRVVKFFPAGVYGGLAALKALSGPFGELKFVPTGGVNSQNIAEFSAMPCVLAVGGSWVCPKADILSANFEKITALCREAILNSLGFEIAHVGINTESDAASTELTNRFVSLFGFAPKFGNSSNFAGQGLEIMKHMYLGQHGHIAVRTACLPRAKAYLEKLGYTFNMDSASWKGNQLRALYLNEEFGGFAVHLLQK